jgi:CIC family chloride channel protein
MKAAEITSAKSMRMLIFYLLSVLIGIFAGLGAVVFRGLIALFHNLFFLGKLSLNYDANVHTAPSPWGPFVILIPVLGAMGVAFLVKNFAPEAKGHGVPEVMDAIYHNKGIIRPMVAVIKSLASALSIGSGGSVGREGPIIQIGASFGSTVGQFLHMPVWQRVTLIAAGASGGIAATFNTPVGGIIFAIEIMMQEISVRTLVPVAISTATATYVGQLFFGAHPSFVIPSFETPYFHTMEPQVLLTYVGLGLLIGVVSALFIRSVYGFEDFFEKCVPGNYYIRHGLGMLIVGIILYLMMSLTGHYYIEGVGYATVQDVLSGSIRQVFGFLVLLFVLKLLSTSLTLGSGASGGVFSPALFMGSTLGGAYGILLNSLFPKFAISPPAFAVAGMAGMVGGSTGAAVAAIVMIYEMTLDYTVLIPMTITVAISYGVRRFLSKESIYTLKLERRGHSMPDALQTNQAYQWRAKIVMDKRFMFVPSSMTLDDFINQELVKKNDAPYFLVTEGPSVSGLVIRESALAARASREGGTLLGDLAQEDFIVVQPETALSKAFAGLRKKKADFIMVVDGDGEWTKDQVVGVITKDRLADVIVESTELFSD